MAVMTRLLRCEPRVGQRGFTLIELLVVMAVIGLLLAITAPRYVEHVDRARESVLKQNLAAVRDAIDKFHADRARYPVGIAELVQMRYLREVPLDPLTDRNDTWILIGAPPQNTAIVDVRSGAAGAARDGTSYAKW